MNKINKSDKIYVRSDLPLLEIGDRIEVTLKNSVSGKDKVRLTNFKGIVISQRNKKSPSYTFSVIKESNKVCVKSVFSYHSPLIHSIKKVGKLNQKVRRAKLYYLERSLAEKKDNE
jgi:ribosomal protein L19